MKKIIISLFLFSLSVVGLRAQSSSYQSTMDFLTIGTDAKAAGMANTAVASRPDLNSHQWNPAKYIFQDNKGGVSAFYSPWMNKTGVKDMGMYGLTGFYKFDSLQSLSSSFRYFSGGNVDYFDETNNPVGSFGSHELAFDVAYSRRLSKSFSGAIALRYANSKLASNSAVSQDHKAGHAVAADLSVYYFKPLTMLRMPTDLTFGLALTNIGTKVSYGSGDGDKSYFLPAQFKFGAGLSSALNSHNRLSLTGQIQKYMVPTDAAKVDDSSLSGLFSSFSDGMRSVQFSFGAEYDYNDMVKARIGYFTESKKLGNRKYMSFGLGGKYKSVELDLAYFVETSMKEHPMSNTILISLSVAFPWVK